MIQKNIETTDQTNSITTIIIILWTGTNKYIIVSRAQARICQGRQKCFNFILCGITCDYNNLPRKNPFWELSLFIPPMGTPLIGIYYYYVYYSYSRYRKFIFCVYILVYSYSSLFTRLSFYRLRDSSGLQQILSNKN